MKLVLPSLSYGKDFGIVLRKMKKNGEAIFWKEVGSPAATEDYIRIRKLHSKGKNLPDGWIPSTTYWLIHENSLIGEINIRHELTEHLRKIGGHIGYWISPVERKKGYGKHILRLGLKKAKLLGLNTVLITCDETNVGSRKIIETNGGVFERKQNMGTGKPKKLLFWISV